MVQTAPSFEQMTRLMVQDALAWLTPSLTVTCTVTGTDRPEKVVVQASGVATTVAAPSPVAGLKVAARRSPSASAGRLGNGTLVRSALHLGSTAQMVGASTSHEEQMQAQDSAAPV